MKAFSLLTVIHFVPAKLLKLQKDLFTWQIGALYDTQVCRATLNFVSGEYPDKIWRGISIKVVKRNNVRMCNGFFDVVESPLDFCAVEFLRKAHTTTIILACLECMQ